MQLWIPIPKFLISLSRALNLWLVYASQKDIQPNWPSELLNRFGQPVAVQYLGYYRPQLLL